MLTRRAASRSSLRLVTAAAVATLVVALSAPVRVSAGEIPPLSTADALASAGLPRRELLDAALAAYHRLAEAGLVRTHLLTVIDYSLPASERRLWVIDTDRTRLLFHELVAHGRGSANDADPERAVRFGNGLASHRSSLGTFLTGATYTGTHGHSLELVGVDAGVNDRAAERRIVMHPANYVTAAHRAQWGHIGRSWGCPALDPAVASTVIDTIQDGSVVYAAAAPAPPATPLVKIAHSGAALASGAHTGATLVSGAHAAAAFASGPHGRGASTSDTRRRGASATRGRRSSGASSRI